MVTPIPRAAASPTMVRLRMVKGPAETIMLTPVMAMMENTEIVAPPRTALGMVVSTAENLGTSPATPSTTAAKANTLRLMTLFMVTMPTFWL